jgi:predicted dehydrogenase
MIKNLNRRKFMKTTTVAGVGLSLPGTVTSIFGKNMLLGKGRIGMIGLDTSHSVAFTKLLNAENANPQFQGYKVVAAYPRGSRDIESSTKRIPGYTEDVKKLGVEIVGSIADLLSKVDAVLLETNDGRLHLEQALPVIKAGKPLFIDKPIAASLSDAIAIFDAAKHYNVPVFSSSSARFKEGVQSIVQGKAGKVIGAQTYSPATIEKTHPDLFWYGIHGVETLFTLMGTGCKEVVRVHADDADVVVGTWDDGRIGTFRGTRSGAHDQGAVVFGEEETVLMKLPGDYNSLLVQIMEFFSTGIAPVSSDETLEIFAFMEAADESKRKGGARINLEDTLIKARKKNDLI